MPTTAQQGNEKKLAARIYLHLPFFLLVIGAIAILSSQLRAQGIEYHEAPQLTALVEAGELPTVEERLPINPMVVPVTERIGDYGGTWSSALLGGGDESWLRRTIGYNNLVRWNPEWTETIPNIVESVAVSEDATEFTFILREGMKWSDGFPFTADDITFWYEDIFLNEELTVAKPAWLIADGEPVVVTKLDSHTVKFTFASPQGFFLARLATSDGSEITYYPRHYLEQFHHKYNSDGIDALSNEANASDWVELFRLKAGSPQDTSRWQVTELPTLQAWKLTTAYGTGNQVVAERNPYFFKVDTEGNQLPYLDRVVFDVVEEEEVLLLKAMNGEIDMINRHINTFTNKSILSDNMSRGGFHFFETVPATMNTMVIFPNHTHKDPIKRQILQNKDFRIGLSYAINRQEIIDLVYVGQGEPYQAAPRPESEFFDEQFAKQYTEYDVTLANEHLDLAGYRTRDAQGFRLGPDDRRISLVVEVDGNAPEWVDALQLIQTYWREVGIDMEVRAIDRSLLYSRLRANEQDMVVWGGDGGLSYDLLLGPVNFFPVEVDWSKFAPGWAMWYQGDSRGEEPPELIQEQLELYDQVQESVDPTVQYTLMQQALEITKDQFYTIGISLTTAGYGIVKDNFRNVPDSMPQAGRYATPGPTNPEQYFIDSGSN